MKGPLADRSNVAGPRRRRAEGELAQCREPSARSQPTRPHSTPSPPPCSRKHSPWTNPKQRKNRRVRDWEHEQTVEEKGDDEAGADSEHAADCEMQVLQQLQSVCITSSPEGQEPPQSGVRGASDPSRDAPDAQDISPPKKVKLVESTIFEDPSADSPARSDLNLESVIDDKVHIRGQEAGVLGPTESHRAGHGHPADPVAAKQAQVAPLGRALPQGQAAPQPADLLAMAVGSAEDGSHLEDNDYLFLRRRDIETDSSSWSCPSYATSDSAHTDSLAGSPRATSPLRIAQYTQKLNQAARHCDLEEAEVLWQELGRSGMDPDVHALNALLRCFLRGGVAYSVATAVVEDTCSTTTVLPNNFTEQLLSSLMLQTEQLGADW